MHPKVLTTRRVLRQQLPGTKSNRQRQRERERERDRQRHSAIERWTSRDGYTDTRSDSLPPHPCSPLRPSPPGQIWKKLQVRGDKTINTILRDFSQHEADISPWHDITRVDILSGANGDGSNEDNDTMNPLHSPALNGGRKMALSDLVPGGETKVVDTEEDIGL